MAYRPRRVSRRRRTTSRAAPVRRRRTTRRRTTRRGGTQRIVIQLVGPGGGVPMSPYTLGKKAASPLLRARY